MRGRGGGNGMGPGGGRGFHGYGMNNGGRSGGPRVRHEYVAKGRGGEQPSSREAEREQQLTQVGASVVKAPSKTVGQ